MLSKMKLFLNSRVVFKFTFVLIVCLFFAVNFTLSPFFLHHVLAQTVGEVSIFGFQEIEEGGTATFTASQGETLTLTLPDGVSGTVSVEVNEVEDPTSGGINILFIGSVFDITLVPTNACSNLCDLIFTFTDDHLVSAGISDPEDVVIFQDTDKDGVFESLPTVLIDGTPSPFAVKTTITSTSFFGIGVLDVEFFCGKTLGQWESEGANIVFGTEKRDKLRGTKNVDVIFGLGGNDRILGKDGDDCLIGGEGNDRIVGGDGNDVIFGNVGKDRLHGGKGNDTIDGGEGNERITGNKGNDQLSGGDGNDKIKGGKGDDAMFGNDGKDKLDGGSGNDILDGGPGFDECEGGEGIDTIINCEEIEDEEEEEDDDNENNDND